MIDPFTARHLSPGLIIYFELAEPPYKKGGSDVIYILTTNTVPAAPAMWLPVSFTPANTARKE